MSIKQFKSIIIFTEYLTDVLNHYTEEYREFLKESESDEWAKFVIYEDINGRINAITVSADIDEIMNICTNDKIVCIIDKDLKITNYNIKKDRV